jgi:hypothetical protein
MSMGSERTGSLAAFSKWRRLESGSDERKVKSTQKKGDGTEKWVTVARKRTQNKAEPQLPGFGKTRRGVSIGLSPEAIQSTLRRGSEKWGERERKGSKEECPVGNRLRGVVCKGPVIREVAANESSAEARGSKGAAMVEV